jgi:hypothetical protein
MKKDGKNDGLWMFNSERMNLRRDAKGNLVLTNRPEEEELEGDKNSDEEIEEIEEFEEGEEEDEWEVKNTILLFMKETGGRGRGRREEINGDFAGKRNC